MGNATSDFNKTPNSNRVHIAFFGRRNVGKSSLINAVTGQSFAIVSDTPGTTTDPIHKAMEIHGIGPCLLIDTAGFDDVGDLGQLRVDKTLSVLDKTDIAVMVLTQMPTKAETAWALELKNRKIAVVTVINKADVLTDVVEIEVAVQALFGHKPITVSAQTGQGIDALLNALRAAAPSCEDLSLTADLVQAGDSVLLVMPQDIQAPKGRLILPQVQTIRDLLDHKCVVTCCTADTYDVTLGALQAPPRLIITDSQLFRSIFAKKPQASKITSFSILMAKQKGDIAQLVAGANAFDRLTNTSRVLIAEACTHAPMEEDIGRVKIPRLLRQRYGEGITFDLCSGGDYPQDLSGYDVIIHCGGCMFSRRHVLSRLARAQAQGVAITNYGVALAKLGGILDDVVY